MRIVIVAQSESIEKLKKDLEEYSLDVIYIDYSSKRAFSTICQAVDEGAEVFVAPGKNGFAKDPFGLISSGAKVAYEAKDILDELWVPAIKI